MLRLIARQSSVRWTNTLGIASIVSAAARMLAGVGDSATARTAWTTGTLGVRAVTRGEPVVLKFRLYGLHRPWKARNALSGDAKELDRNCTTATGEIYRFSMFEEILALQFVHR